MLRGRVISTEYEYDDSGRMVRSFASPAWTSDDRDVMLALVEYEASLCPGCGQPKDHAWHPDMEGWFDEVEFTCHSCAAIATPQQAVYKTTRSTWPEGRPWLPWPTEQPATPPPAPPPPIPA